MDAAHEQQSNSRPWLEPHRFPPGQSGNPGGRPKGRSLTSIIREVLDSNSIKGKPLPEGRTVADVLAEVFVAEALKGKFPFAKEVIDRTEGKVPDKLETKNETSIGLSPQLKTGLDKVYPVSDGNSDPGRD